MHAIRGATKLTLLVTIVVALTGVPEASATTPVASPSPTRSMGDVPMFRGDPAHTGAMPGPGPKGQPTVRWQAAIADAIYSTAAVVDGIVYVATDDGNTVAVDALTGEIVWTVEDTRGYSSVAVVDGLVIVGEIDGSLQPGGQVAAFDATTGDAR